MSDRPRSYSRALIWALPVWALTLLLGTLTHQPDPLTRFGAWSRYVTTRTFLASHLVNSIIGAAIGSLRLIALMLYLSDTRTSGRAFWAMVTGVSGNTITSAVFGVAAFTQPALGRAFLSGVPTAAGLYRDVYGVPLFATAGAGLLLFIAGGVLAGLAIARSEVLPAWAGWVLVVAIPVFALANIFLPAFLQSVAALAALVATAAVAWSAHRQDRVPVQTGHFAPA
jgi:hypothetical protein